MNTKDRNELEEQLFDHERTSSGNMTNRTVQPVIPKSVHLIRHNNVTSSLTTAPSYSATTVYISGMPIRYCTETVIEKLFSRYGTIVRCTVHTRNLIEVYAFCDFTDATQATNCVHAIHGRLLGGHPLTVRHAFTKEQYDNYKFYCCT